MSIQITHPRDIILSTGDITITTSNKLSRGMINLDSSAVKLPNVQSVMDAPPSDGAITFERAIKRLRYYDGVEWITIRKDTEITDPINSEISSIKNILNTKVDTVISGVSSEPMATISGTTLYINFPVSGGGSGSNDTGLFSTAPEGAIQGYSLMSGQTHEQARATLGDQSSSDGSPSRPFVTRNGWCIADGKYWKWEGEKQTIVKQVPNLNDQSPFLSGTPYDARTITDRVIASTGQVDGHVLTVGEMPRHKHGIRLMHAWEDTKQDAEGFPNTNWMYNPTADYSAIHPDSQPDYSWCTPNGGGNPLGSVGGNQPHSHGLSNVSPNHCKVIWMYNIATPEKALTIEKGDGRYVLKRGDNMTGSLGIQGRVTPTDYGNFDERYVQKSGSAIPQMWAGDNDISVAVTGNYTRLLLSAVGHFDRPNDGTTLRQVYFTIYKNGTQVAQATTTIYNTKGGSKGHSWRYEDDGVVFKQYGITMAPGDVIRVVGSGSYLKSTNIRVDFC